jgi:hypothetical protein
MTNLIKTIGSIAWPSQRTRRHGWAMTLDIVANDANPEKMLFRGEKCVKSNDVLVLVGWGKAQAVGDWYSDMDKRAINVMAYHHFNLPFSPAPYIDATDSLSLYLQILHQCLGVEKLLTLNGLEIGENSKEQTKDIRNEPTVKIQDYPALAALSYAVSAAYLWYKAPEKEIIPTHAEHIMAFVESGEECYESYVEKYINRDNEVYGRNIDDLW